MKFIQSFSREKLLYLLLTVLGLLIICVTLAIYIDYQKDKNADDYLDKMSAQLKLSNCLSKAESDFKNGWQEKCELGYGVEDCVLYPTVSDQLNKQEQADRDVCFKEYPQ